MTSYLSYLKTANRKINGAHVPIQNEPSSMASVLTDDQINKLFEARLKDINEMSSQTAKDLNERF